MTRASLLVGFLAVTFGLGGGGVTACGDLVIPGDGSDDGGAGDGAVPVDCDAGVPAALECTGLYADFTHLTLASDVHAYQPGATMWNDGATSLRWIALPSGSKIDTSDPNNWVFPVGTKIWQELSILGKRIETRFLWKESAGLWFRATFVWSDDQKSAPPVTLGVPNARGLPYEIPAVSACEKCHDGANDFVLGYEGVGLGLPQATGLTLTALKQQAWLTAPPASVASLPGDPTTQGALVFLHANCGTSCHNRNLGAQAGQTGLFMKLTVDATGALPSTAPATDTWMTAYKVPSIFSPTGAAADAGGVTTSDVVVTLPDAATPLGPDAASADAAPETPDASAGTTTTNGPDAGDDTGSPGAGPADSGTTSTAGSPPPASPPSARAYRLWPGDVVRSMVTWRTGRRDGVTQMPPIGTHVVDANDVALLSTWVRALPP